MFSFQNFLGQSLELVPFDFLFSQLCSRVLAEGIVING